MTTTTSIPNTFSLEVISERIWILGGDAARTKDFFITQIAEVLALTDHHIMTRETGVGS